MDSDWPVELWKKWNIPIGSIGFGIWHLAFALALDLAFALAVSVIDPFAVIDPCAFVWEFIVAWLSSCASPVSEWS